MYVWKLCEFMCSGFWVKFNNDNDDDKNLNSTCWVFSMNQYLAKFFAYTDAPWLTMKLHPAESIISWKYKKLKMHLIHPMCKMSLLNNIMHCRVPAVSPVIWWLSWSCSSWPLASISSHHKLLAWEKAQIQNSKKGFYWIHITSAPVWSWKIVS
jgi:hypothetical protein